MPSTHRASTKHPARRFCLGPADTLAILQDHQQVVGCVLIQGEGHCQILHVGVLHDDAHGYLQTRKALLALDLAMFRSQEREQWTFGVQTLGAQGTATWQGHGVCEMVLADEASV